MIFSKRIKSRNVVCLHLAHASLIFSARKTQWHHQTITGKSGCKAFFICLFTAHHSMSEFNFWHRFWNVPFSFLVQVSVGSVYAWSVFNSPLTKELGVVAAAADDWTLSQVLPIFSTCALTLGLTTAIFGSLHWL